MQAKCAFGSSAAHHARGGAGVDQVVDDQEPGPVAGRRRRLGDLRLAALLILIGDDADALHQPQIQLPRDDRGRDQSAAADRDNAGEGPICHQPPGQGARVAMKLVPGDSVVMLCHGGFCAETDGSVQGVLTALPPPPRRPYASSEQEGRDMTEVIVEQAGPVLEITFNRPEKKNALTRGDVPGGRRCASAALMTIRRSASPC